MGNNKLLKDNEFKDYLMKRFNFTKKQAEKELEKISNVKNNKKIGGF